MRKILARFKQWLLVLFVRPPKTVKTPRPRLRRGKDVEEAGQWYFKRDILEKLDEYMVCIRRMKKTDPQGYKTYSRIGATTIPDNTLLDTRLSSRWKNNEYRPLFGAIALLGEEQLSEYYYMKFGYFHRLDRVPPQLQPTNGQVYEVTTFHNRVDDGTKWGRVSMHFYVSLDEKGCVTPLLFVAKRKQVINHKDRASKWSKTSTLQHHTWTYGSFLEDDTFEDSAICDDTIQGRAEKVFAIIAGGYVHAASALRVSATKNQVTAAFGIDLLRTPYFFNDRDASFTEKGVKKKIFHIVRTHPRILPNGKTIFVKSHFRGKRDFKWNGYDVLVSMPGKHHSDLLDMSFGAHILDKDEDRPKGFIGHKKFLHRIDAHLRGASLDLSNSKKESKINESVST